MLRVSDEGQGHTYRQVGNIVVGSSEQVGRRRRKNLAYAARNGRSAVDCFFFQAEDGIRDYKVTGVQTCALPILTVQAMKAGAVEFLTKPFTNDVLLDAVAGAIERSRTAVRQESEVRMLRSAYALLTPREREVMALVVSGLLNKQVGGELGISEITVKAHRGQMMRKMKADSLPELVTMAARLGLRPAGTV